MRIAIVESQTHVRGALTFFLRQQLCAEVVCAFGPSRDLVVRLLTLRPEVVFLDWELPRLLARRFLEATRKMASPPMVIVLSVHLEAESEALAAGAQAFIFKGEGPEFVRQALATAQARQPIPT